MISVPQLFKKNPGKCRQSLQYNFVANCSAGVLIS